MIYHRYLLIWQMFLQFSTFFGLYMKAKIILATLLTGVSCSDEDEKPRKRRRTNSSSSSPVMLKEVTKVSPQVSKNITVPVSGSPKMSNIMQSIANSLPPHLSPVKITFTKPAIQTTNTTTQKVRSKTTSAPSLSCLSALNSKISQICPGDHRDDLCQLQLCAQHPVKVSQQRRII